MYRVIMLERQVVRDRVFEIDEAEAFFLFSIFFYLFIFFYITVNLILLYLSRIFNTSADMEIRNRTSRVLIGAKYL